MGDIKSNILRLKLWRIENNLVVILYIILLIIQTNCQNVRESLSSTKSVGNLDINVDKQCHSCHISDIKDLNNDTNTESNSENYVEDLITTIGTITKKYLLVNKTEEELENELENLVDNALNKDRYEIFDGIEIKSIGNSSKEYSQKETAINEARALFPKYSYEYRLYTKVKNFIDTHILSISLPKAARLVGFRSFGLKKFFLPLLIGAQVFKSILLAMFLPSILGSFGKILGKGISHLSASSSQASYPPVNANTEEGAYSNDNKDFMGYETNPSESYAYPQDGLYLNMDANQVNDLSDVDMSRYGAGGQKVAYLPVKNGYYKNQVASASTNYKVFQKIPASSMILNNYDPFYSPLLSRLDGIFARLGLAPSENAVDSSPSLSDVKLEACREQLICLMYSSPAKYAPYSNLISAQLSRELNELRRPVSDNPEILRFFRYMRAARRGQEGAECSRVFPGCGTPAPALTMVSAYHDINKLVTARKLSGHW